MKRLAFLFPLVFACSNDLPPIGQLVLYVDTDAPVPPPSGQSLSRSDPAPLFDTIRIEIFEPGATVPCEGCTREFAIDSGKFGAAAVSVGIPAKPGVSGYRARVTLFLEEWVYPCSLIPDAEKSLTDACDDPNASVPHPSTVLETTVALPPVIDAQVTETSVLLETESVGQPQGSLDAPLDTTPGKPAPSQVGTWPGATRRDCTTVARPGEACVPSGAFWQGNARPSLWEKRIFTPHLVVLSPFFLKTTEVTVEECRSVAVCDSLTTPSASQLPTCNYTHTPSGTDKRAANCVLTPAKRAYCKAWGGDLPTLAQIEYAGRGTTGSTYVWGNDDPQCDDAMFLRASEQEFVTQQSCYKASVGHGPYQPGNGTRDRLELPTGTIVDLDGNVTECTRDAFDATCDQTWPAGVLYDPVASSGTALNGWMGGDWQDGPLALSPNGHGCIPPNYLSIEYGFRCGRADE